MQIVTNGTSSCARPWLAAKDAATNIGDIAVDSEQHFRTAQSTYNGFIGLFKWGTVAAIAVAALVVLLIAK